MRISDWSSDVCSSDLDDQPVVVEPLDPERHDRAAFRSGIAQVDNYFHRTANKLAKAGNVRVYVMTSTGGDLIGFYAINAHARSEEHTSELQSLMRISYAVFCLKKKTDKTIKPVNCQHTKTTQ